jgi:hypothetical protein
MGASEGLEIGISDKCGYGKADLVDVVGRSALSRFGLRNTN